MSDIERLFEQARAGGASHYQALREVERATGLDLETIKRALQRAKRQRRAPERKE